MRKSKQPQDLVRTKDFDTALHAMEHGSPFVFVTGRAGTGKSTLLRHFRNQGKLRCVILAPTGVAALNVEGETIHRFFRFGPDVTVRDAKKKGAAAADDQLYQAVDVIVVDEISMVRADLFDAMDAFLRAARRTQSPFGGVRVVVIGDLFQLPPVLGSEEAADYARLYATPFFFGSTAFQDLVARREVTFVELERVFRQADPRFVDILNAVRDRTADATHLETLRQRVGVAHKDAIVLTSTNAAADEINQRKLAALPGKAVGYTGTAQGVFGEKEMPTSHQIVLVPGARVMFVANDPEGRYVNGTVGTVRTCEPKRVVVETDDEEWIDVEPHTWTLYRSSFDAKHQSLKQEKIGSFTQIPLRLAWAVTIHKSQGKTFDRVHIDLGRGAFASGQTYVGLSRARSLEGLTLAKPVERRHILVDETVVTFFKELPGMLKDGAKKGATKSMF